MKSSFYIIAFRFVLTSNMLRRSSSFQLMPTAVQGVSMERTHDINVNFDDWISDAPQEVTNWTPLNVTGRIPDYVKGTLVRNGPALWKAGEDTVYSHIFDGLAKLSAYRIHADGSVEYQNRFIQSNMYQKVKRDEKLPPLITTGPLLHKKNNMEPLTGLSQVLKATWNTRLFDNAGVNVWDYDPLKVSKASIAAITDNPARATVSFSNLETLSSSSQAPTSLKGILGYEFTETAHPLYSLTSDETYNVAVCVTLGGPQIVLLKESASGDRRVICKVKSDGMPYFHSFGLTDRYAVIVVQPLRTNPGDMEALLSKGFLRSMQEVSNTRVLVVDLQRGECVLDQVVEDKVYFYHAISTAATKNEQGQECVSLRLCAYKTPDIITGEDQFMRLERCQGSKEARNRISRGGTFCDVVCNLETQQVNVDWKEMEQNQGFELPTTRYSRTHGPGAEHVARQHPKYVYAFGTFAFQSNEYDSWGLFKFEPEKGRIAAHYRRQSVYVSEPIFVANPVGTEEDDGVILSQVYDGERRETALLILDAKTMEILAEAWTGNRCPMDFHGTWFPEP